MQLPERGEGKSCSGSKLTFVIITYLVDQRSLLCGGMTLQLPNHQSGEYWFLARQTARTYVAVVGSI